MSVWLLLLLCVCVCVCVCVCLVVVVVAACLFVCPFCFVSCFCFLCFAVVVEGARGGVIQFLSSEPMALFPFKSYKLTVQPVRL